MSLAHFCSLISRIQSLISSQGPCSTFSAAGKRTHFIPVWLSPKQGDAGGQQWHHKDHHNGHCEDLLPTQGSRDCLPSPSEDKNCHRYENASFRPEGAELLGQILLSGEHLWRVVRTIWNNGLALQFAFFCPSCQCPFLSWIHSSFFVFLFVLHNFSFFLFALCLFQASITADATGNLLASVSNCDKILIFSCISRISTRCDFNKKSGIIFFLY